MDDEDGRVGGGGAGVGIWSGAKHWKTVEERMNEVYSKGLIKTGFNV